MGGDGGDEGVEEGGEGVAEAAEGGLFGGEGVVCGFLELEGFLDLGEGGGGGVLVFDVVGGDIFVASAALGGVSGVGWSGGGIGGLGGIESASDIGSNITSNIYETHLQNEIDHVLHGFRVVLLVLLGPLLRNIIVIFLALENRVYRTRKKSAIESQKTRKPRSNAL